MNTEQEIRLAVCAKYLKQDLQTLEASLQERQSDARSQTIYTNLIPNKTMKKKTIISLCVAAAACCALVIGLHINQSAWADAAFTQGMSNTQIYVSRGDNRVDNQLQDAYQLLFAGQFRDSDRVLKELTATIKDTKPETADEEQILLVQRDEQQWLHALNLLGQGKYRKAKKLLKQIAKENGTFATQAEQLLQLK